MNLLQVKRPATIKPSAVGRKSKQASITAAIAVREARYRNEFERGGEQAIDADAYLIDPDAQKPARVNPTKLSRFLGAEPVKRKKRTR